MFNNYVNAESRPEPQGNETAAEYKIRLERWEREEAGLYLIGLASATSVVDYAFMEIAKILREALVSSKGEYDWESLIECNAIIQMSLHPHFRLQEEQQPGDEGVGYTYVDDYGVTQSNRTENYETRRKQAEFNNKRIEALMLLLSDPGDQHIGY